MLNVSISGVTGLLDHARRLHAAGKVPDAEKLYRRVLALQPDHPVALNLLGTVAMQFGKLADAEQLFRRALVSDARYAEAHNHLGAVLAAMKRWPEAESEYQLALSLRPDYAEAHHNLGLLLVKKTRIEEGIAQYRRAIELMPSFAPARYNLGMALAELGQTEEALACHCKAVELQPAFADSFEKLAATLTAKGRDDDARKVLETGLQLHPDSENLRFLLAALKGDHSVKKAPPQFVASLFETYAYFDEHLAHLNYRGPEFLREAINAVAPARKFDILDIGCGTGLSGAPFKDIATRLVGVDFAASMIDHAKARAIYDELRTADLTAVLREAVAQWDLILAADVLIYIGDADDLFAAVKTALRPGGLFALTVEKSETDDLKLLRSLRYAHSLGYLRTLAHRHGLEELHAQERQLRTENKNPIPAWILVLRNP
ncbi:MAG TPA: tetratricopeptide repeat protein [Phycisphaerae bacterium]|nr:tetratricopeptide repeat protein [Phycisphaerae bacterium]